VPTGITYENTKTTVLGWMPLHKSQPLGYAYETSSHFVHIYGGANQFWVLSTGLTATERKSGTLVDWVNRVFGAKASKQLKHDPGTVIDGVWRPGLYYQGETLQALSANRVEQRGAEQSLHVLVDRLNDLLLFTEPEGAGLSAYGAKSRELLILACTEVEDAWMHYMRRAKVKASGQRYSTNQYVRLRDPLHLPEYEVSLAGYSKAPKVRPFRGWSGSKPTVSLPWYDAYNNAKHDRTANLSMATLLRCIEAVAANLILFCVRFSPFPLYQQSTPIASLVNHLFTIELVNCDPATFYVPLVSPPATMPSDLVCGQMKDFVDPWKVKPLVL
jgi:hypothetical protein